MSGKHWLMASLLYGSGLRLTECLRLRVQDIDFEFLQLTIRDGKGAKDRQTTLSESLLPHIKQHLTWVHGICDRDLKAGRAGASLPHAIDRKYRNASREWKWQYVFPSSKYAYIHRNSGQRRHHAHSSGLARAVKIAVHATGINKRRVHWMRCDLRDRPSHSSPIVNTSADSLLPCISETQLTKFSNSHGVADFLNERHRYLASFLSALAQRHLHL